MPRKRRKRRKKIAAKQEPDKQESYIQVLAWWAPLFLLGAILTFIVYDDLIRNGDAAGLTVEYIPTTKSKSLGAGLLLLLLIIVAGASELLRIYRKKRRKPPTDNQL